MTCFYPVDAWRSARVNPETGKRGISFSRSDGFSDMPLQVPCGSCQGCKSDMAQAWAIRIYCEASLWDQNAFVTLTYTDAPPALDKKHLQDFFKRLRHKAKFRYFACGEYGGLTHRPHYHVIFFGCDFLGGSLPLGDGELYTHPDLEAAWGHGFVSCGSLTMASSCYVAGYANKKLGDPDTFNLMSRRPGIGHDWLTRYADDIRRIGSVVIEGKELPVPKRFLDWAPDELESVVAARRLMFQTETADERWSRRVAVRSKEINKISSLRLRGESI